MLKHGFAAAMAALAVAWNCNAVAHAQAPAVPAPAAEAPGPALPPGVYKTIPPIESLYTDKIKQGKFWSQVRAMLNNPNQAPTEANKTLFDAYYKQFYFPLMTLTEQEHLEALPKERERFFRDHLEYCKFPGTHTALVELTLDTLKKIVPDEGFHPAVRYNALLIIGGLNAQEAVRVGSTKLLPVPYLPAFSVLVAELKNPTSNDAVRVAALLGIARHLEWDNAREPSAGSQIPPPIRAEVLTDLLTLATQKDPPPDRNAEGHAWLRRRAIEALALLGAKKPETTIAEAIDKILADDSEPLAVRCTAATAIRKLSYAPPLKFDPADAAKKLGYLALVACDHELNRLTAVRKLDDQRYGVLNPLGGEGMGMPGGMPMQGPRTRPQYGGAGSADGGYGGPADLAAVDPKAYRRDLFCRRVRAYLGSVQVGLRTATDAVGGPLPAAKASGSKAPGAKAAGGKASGKAADTAAAAPATAPLVTATPADRKYVDDVRVAVEALIKIVEIPEVELATIESDLRRTMQPLEAMTKKLGAVAKPAGAADDADVDLPGAAAPGGRGRPRAAAGAPAPAAGAPAPAAGAPAPASDLPAGDLPEAGAPVKPAPAAPMPAAPMPAAAVPAPMPAAAAPAAVTPPDPLDASGAK